MKTCPMCDKAGAVRHMPREVKRDLSHEEITVPAEPEPRHLTVAILRITYERDYFCPHCGHHWTETYETVKQQHV